jgi:hypothetical protein
MSKFSAEFMSCVDESTGERQSAKWRIHFSDRKGFSWSFHDFSRDLGFMSKTDCEIAIANLEKHGIVDDEGIEPLTDDELAKICCEHLRW